MKTALYDAVTLEIERAEVLADFLADRLHDLSEDEEPGGELFALSLIAKHLHEHGSVIRERAKMLYDAYDATRPTSGVAA